MKKSLIRLLSVLSVLCLMLSLTVPVFAAGDTDDPNVFLSKGVYTADDYADTDTVVTFDPASGRLTIDDRGNAVPIADENAFYEWIKGIAPGVKTVFITKSSELNNFSYSHEIREWDVDGETVYEEAGAYSNNVFWKAFSYLEDLERFEVESGNPGFEAKDGVLYTKGCYYLVHYPAAKPDKTYKIDPWCMLGIYPYAFCNTRYLERVELPYARSGNFNYMMIEEYAFGALDLDTGEAKQSSVKQFVFYGTKEEFGAIITQFEGNNAADGAEVVCLKTNVIKDIIAYLKFNVFMRFRMMLGFLSFL